MGVGDGRTFELEFTAEGEKNVIAAIRGLANELKKVQVSARGAAKSGSELGRSFRNILLRTTAIIGVFRTFDLLASSIRSVVAAGIDYNEVIETSTLAIASLITATSLLVDENDEVIGGVEALDIAYGLAVDQVNKLRIAGIQTAATTKELVDAFQQATGAGLAAGLSLDDIRTITIRIAQAAGALGVPYRQLNEEIRSLLSGTIDQNTRIAKALGIQNEQVRLAREQGVLAEFLLDKFEAFGIAGERIVETFSALRSTVKETFDILAGDAIRPLFEALRTRGLASVQQIFDFDTAQISDAFQPLIDGFQLVFAEIGDLIADGIERALQGGEALAGFFEENADTVLGVVDSLDRVVRSTARIISQMSKWASESGLVGQSLETIADAFEIIGDSKFLQLLLGGGLVLGLFALANFILGPVVAGVLGLALGVGLLIGQIDKAIVSQAELNREQTRAITIQAQQDQKIGDATVSVIRMAKEIDRLTESMKGMEKGSDELTGANTLLESIFDSLADVSERYADILGDESLSRDDQIRLIKEETAERVKLLDAQIANLEAQQGETEALLAKQRIQRQIDVRGINLPGFRLPGFLTPGGVSAAELRSLEEQVDVRRKALDALREVREEITSELEEPDIRLVGKGGDDTDGDEFIKALRARSALALAQIKADLAESESLLQDALARNTISYQDFFDQISAARDQALGDQIAIQRELQRAETDSARKLSIEARIIQLESSRAIQRRRDLLTLTQQQEKLEAQVGKAQVRLLEATGQAAAAAKLKIQLEFRDLLKRLDLEGREADASDIRSLERIEIARAEFKQLEKVIKEGQQTLRDTISQIQLEEQIGIIFGDEAKERTAAAYGVLRDQLGLVIGDLEEMVEVGSDPVLQESARQLLILFKQLELQIEALTNQWLIFRKELRDIAEQELTNFLADAVINAESLGEAFDNLKDVKSLFGAIATEIVRVTARLIALQIIQSAIGVGGGVAGFFSKGGLAGLARGGLVRAFAAGGSVRGPGGPTSDKVLARLSAGEYVVRASSVRRFGTDFMDAVNRGSVPRAVKRLESFAAGGQVGTTGSNPAGRAGSGADFRGELKVRLGEGVVVDDMDTPAGSRVVLRVIGKNRRAIRKQLGL